MKTRFTEKQGQYLAFIYLIERVPGQGRSIRLKIPREQLPDLE